MNGSSNKLLKKQKRGKKCALLLCLILSLIMLLLGIALGIFLFNHYFANCIDLRKLISRIEPEVTLEDEIYESCGQEYPWKELRLPSNVRPSNYKLRIYPNLDTRVLKGTVDLEIEVDNSTNVIVMHAQDINLTSFTLRMGSQLVPVKHVSFTLFRDF